MQCFTLVRPVNDDHLLTQLGIDDQIQTRKEFKDGLHEIKQFIFDQTPKKTNMLNGKEMKPAIFATFIKSCVNEINKSREEGGSIPSLTSAWDAIVNDQLSSCLKKCSEELSRHIESIQMPQYSAVLLLEFDYIRHELMKKVDGVRALIDPEDVQNHLLLDKKQEELEKQMDKQFKKVLFLNDQKSSTEFTKYENDQFSKFKSLETDDIENVKEAFRAYMGSMKT